MKIVNRTGIPDPFGIITEAARKFDEDYDKGESDITTTSIGRPAQMVALENRYWDQLEVDLAECLWRLMGSAMHLLLERVAVGMKDVIIEKRYYKKVMGWNVGGKVDLVLLNEKELIDWKTTSAWHYVFGDLKEYETQGNINRLILNENNISVTKMTNVLIFRDWMKSKSSSGKYPSTPIVDIHLDKWDDDDTNAYLKERVSIHQAAQKCSDEELAVKFPCSIEDRWLNQKTGEFSRCKLDGGYCPVRKLCMQNLKKSKYTKICENIKK